MITKSDMGLVHSVSIRDFFFSFLISSHSHSEQGVSGGAGGSGFLGQGWGMWPVGQTGSVLVFIVLLKHGPTHSFTYCVWLLLATVTKLSSFDRDCVTCKA